MQYVVFHIETAGLDPEEHSMLELGVMIEDTEKPLSFEETPSFNTLIKHDLYKGDPFALHLNSELFSQMSLPAEKRTKNLTEFNHVAHKLYIWLSNHISTLVNEDNKKLDYDGFLHRRKTEDYSNLEPLLLNVAGKNFGVFQHRFIQKIPNISTFLRFNYRFIDPSTLYFDKDKDKNGLPSSEDCKKRAGIPVVRHNDTLKECWDTILLLRNKFQ